MLAVVQALAWPVAAVLIVVELRRCVALVLLVVAEKRKRA